MRKLLSVVLCVVVLSGCTKEENCALEAGHNKLSGAVTVLLEKYKNFEGLTKLCDETAKLAKDSTDETCGEIVLDACLCAVVTDDECRTATKNGEERYAHLRETVKGLDITEAELQTIHDLKNFDRAKTDPMMDKFATSFNALIEIHKAAVEKHRKDWEKQK